MSKYRLKAPVRAVWHQPEGGQMSVTLPAEAVLQYLRRSSFGVIDVSCEGQEYSISEKDLDQNAERIGNA
jgi:hypothetical protein